MVPEKRAGIALLGISKRFGGAAAVDDVTLEIGDGEFFSLLGPSGCGKTTTLRMIAGFVRPDAGRVLLQERDVTDVPANRRPVNLVFQQYALFPHMSVYDNVAFGLSVKRVPRAEHRDRVHGILGVVSLEGFERRRPRQLSGGQQQRVAIARALALSPRVLLFDEPTSALDPELVGEVLDVIRDLARSGTTLIIVTHEIGFAREVADRIVFLDAGRVLEEGPPERVLVDPEHPRTREFLAKVLA